MFDRKSRETVADCKLVDYCKEMKKYHVCVFQLDKCVNCLLIPETRTKKETSYFEIVGGETNQVSAPPNTCESLRLIQVFMVLQCKTTWKLSAGAALKLLSV